MRAPGAGVPPPTPDDRPAAHGRRPPDQGMRWRDLEGGLAEQALREAWPVPAELRPELVRVLAELARSAAASPRERTSAIKALLQASRLNLEALKVAMAADYQDVLEELEGLRDGELAGGGGGAEAAA